MSENLPKIDASPEAKGLDQDLRADMPKNAKEFEVLLGRYQKQNPEKYELKLKSGELSKQAKAMGIDWKSEAEKEAKAMVEAEKEAKAKKDAVKNK